MTSDTWSKWLTLAANVGVFVGLILVAYEINQTQTQLRMEALADGADNFTQAMETLAQNGELSRLIFRAETNFEELDQFERWRVSKYLDGFMTMSEQDYLVLKGLADGENLTGFEHDWHENLAKPFFRFYWSGNEDRFGKEFREFINGILIEVDRT